MRPAVRAEAAPPNLGKTPGYRSAHVALRTQHFGPSMPQTRKMPRNFFITAIPHDQDSRPWRGGTARKVAQTRGLAIDGCRRARPITFALPPPVALQTPPEYAQYAATLGAPPQFGEDGGWLSQLPNTAMRSAATCIARNPFDFFRMILTEICQTVGITR
jgi:hypothetical protein